MSRPRFLADHDLNEHIIDGVQRREPALAFVRARNVDLSDREDSGVLAFAAQHGFIVLSHDVNTMTSVANEILDAGGTMAGLLMVQQTKPIGPVKFGIDLVGERSRRGSVRFVFCRFDWQIGAHVEGPMD